jgi:hypothetical protein
VSDWRKRREKAKQSAFLASAPPEKWKLTIAERFARYWEHVFPDPATRPNDESAQYIETRRAFYAGTFDMLCTMRAIAEPDVSEDEGTDHVEACWRECVAYYERMKKLYGIE